MAFLSTPGTVIVILRGHDQHSVGRLDLGLELTRVRREGLFKVLIETGNALEIEDVQ